MLSTRTAEVTLDAPVVGAAMSGFRGGGKGVRICVCGCVQAAERCAQTDSGILALLFEPKVHRGGPGDAPRGRSRPAATPLSPPLYKAHTRPKTSTKRPRKPPKKPETHPRAKTGKGVATPRHQKHAKTGRMGHLGGACARVPGLVGVLCPLRRVQAARGRRRRRQRGGKARPWRPPRRLCSAGREGVPGWGPYRRRGAGRRPAADCRPTLTSTCRLSCAWGPRRTSQMHSEGAGSRVPVIGFSVWAKSSCPP